MSAAGESGATGGADPIQRIRNFCIIAHIDHGKSTLADRLLEFTGAITEREKRDQFLDKMDLERERGITIKAQSVRLHYRAADGHLYQLNLIDTPGHVDFTYEVSRSLAACEGALLVVDVTQGVQAQTLANAYLAADANLELVPVLNKIDLPAADAERVRTEIEEVVGVAAHGDAAILASAKTGIGTREILEAVIARIPPPAGDAAAPLKALLFDSWYDAYRGAIMLVRVVDGEIRSGQHVRLWATGHVYEVGDIGVLSPHPTPVAALRAGEVGFVAAGIKEVRDARIGDTVTDDDRPCAVPLPGFRDVKPVVFAGIFPTDPGGFEPLRDALAKLGLNDASFTYEPETSRALGFGFRCGFLGLLHMEIIQERLEREFAQELITTAPTVVYRVHTTDGEVRVIDNPSHIPDRQLIERFTEPVIDAHIYVPETYVGAILKLCEDRRGVQVGMLYAGPGRMQVHYKLPLAEVVYDFYDKLKTATRGYGSLDYDVAGYEEADLVRLDILLNGDLVDALSCIVHRERAYERGRDLVHRMRRIIPRQQYEVALQAAIGNKVIARETLKSLRKDVTAKCYGGDITRKRKLLERQKEGKRRMKQVGTVEIPQEAFMAVLSKDDA